MYVMLHGEVSLPPNPKSVEDALNSPDGNKWKEAIENELQNFDDRHTFADAPQTGRV